MSEHIARIRSHSPSPARTRPAGAFARQTLIVLTTIMAALGNQSLGTDASKAARKRLPLHIDFQEKVEVRIVMVPVSVLDRQRRPVLDLSPEEFEILVDGVPVPILAFEPPRAPRSPAAGGVGVEKQAKEGVGPAAQGSGNADARTGRSMPGAAASSPSPLRSAPPRPSSHVAVVIDVYQTRFTRAALAFKAVKNMLESGVPPSSRIGLFIVKYGRLESVMPFTQDKHALLAALDTAYRDAGTRDLWVTEEPHRGVFGDPRDCPQIQLLARAQAMRVRKVVDALRGLSATMEPLTGRKGIVLLSDGLRMRAGTNYAAGRENPYGAWLKAHCSVSVQPEMARLVRELGEAGISLSPISLR